MPANSTPSPSAKARARGVSGAGGVPDAQIEEHDDEADDAAEQRQRQHINTVGKDQLGQHIADAEQGPGYQPGAESV